VTLYEYNEVGAAAADDVEDLRHSDVTRGCYDNNADHHHHRHHHHHNAGARQRHIKVANG